MGYARNGDGNGQAGGRNYGGAIWTRRRRRCLTPPRIIPSFFSRVVVIKAVSVRTAKKVESTRRHVRVLEDSSAPPWCVHVTNVVSVYFERGCLYAQNISRGFCIVFWNQAHELLPLPLPLPLGVLFITVLNNQHG